MKWIRTFGLALAAFVLMARPAFPTAQQIGPGDTALLFGGLEAEGGIGDWYLGNGVVEAIFDDIGIQQDLVGIVPPGDEPQIQTEINPTGGTLIDASRVGVDGDQLPQMFTVGGLSVDNFFLNETISAPDADTIRVAGGILFPPDSVAPSPCLDVVTDFQALGSDPFITITSTVTNNCAGPVGISNLLDVFVWTQRANVPFSGGGFPAAGGGKGFNHAILDLSDPVPALEFMAFMGSPGHVDAGDGICDPTDNVTCGPVSYGLQPVSFQRDPDGAGGGAPDVNVAVNTHFGVSSTLISALGFPPTTFSGGLVAGATLTYVRRLYIGDRNDVRSVSNNALTELATRPLVPAVINGTISGDIDAADDPNVEATIVATRLGRCSIGMAPCKTSCPMGSGSCVDPAPTATQFPGAAVTQIRTDANGTFSGVVLPRGDYELVIEAAERTPVTVSPVVVAGAMNTAVPIPPMSARGTFTFTVTERGGSNAPIPARLTFVGVNPTPNPNFNHDLSALSGASQLPTETFGGTQAGTTGSAAGQGNVVYTATGTGGIAVRPGTYDVYASRGMEFSVDKVTVTVPSGGTIGAEFRIKRAVKTKGAISGDFHVHSGRSLDTSAALRDRVVAFAAEGVEVMVSTDHDQITDYAPLITSLGLGTQMTSIVGNEVTGSAPNPPVFPQSTGHMNTWPHTVQPNESHDGAFQDEFVAPNWLYSRARNAGADVVQINHPRAGLSGITTIGLFNNIGCGRCENDIDTTCTVDGDCPAMPAPQNCTCVGYQPDRTISTPPNDILLDDGVLGPGTAANPDGYDNLAFDVMEILNGTKDGDFPSYRQVRYDWMSLLNQGIIRYGTSVSDSHRITVEHAGWGRTYVLGVGDDPTALDVNAFNTAIKNGAMLMSGGPYIEFSAKCGAAGGIMGSTVACPAGTPVKLKVKVRSPAWMPVEEVRVIANGALLMSFDSNSSPPVKGVPNNFESNGRTSRFRKTIKVEPTVDTYYFVEAGPKFPDPDLSVLPTPPPIVDIIQPDVVPTSLTNPIFISVNGDNDFDPPNTLPPTAPKVRTAEVPAAPGLWERLQGLFASVVNNLRGEAIAQKQPGRMTGVTDEQKRQAVLEGEGMPLEDIRIPEDAAAEAARRYEQAEKDAARAQEEAGNPAQ